MDFTLTEEQTMLKNSARKFMSENFSSEQVRKLWDDSKGFDSEVWSKMADLGWMGLYIPEEYGGLGLAFLDLAMVLEEMGRAVMPGPYFSTVILAAELIKEAGNKEQKERLLGEIASGKLIATAAIYEPDVDFGPEGINLSARRSGDAYILQGTKIFVPDAHIADLMVVAARTSRDTDPTQGISLFLINPKSEGVGIELLPTLDNGRKLCAVTFSDTKCRELLGEPDEGWKAIHTMQSKANIALCSEMVGGGEKVLEIASDYAKVRVQFGQPIGSYQAIKHKCAEIMLKVESSKSITQYAAWIVDDNPEESAHYAAVAKSYVSDMFRTASASTIQILGGIGFTWEHDIHLYYKRAMSSEASYGDQVYQLELIANKWDKLNSWH